MGARGVMALRSVLSGFGFRAVWGTDVSRPINVANLLKVAMTSCEQQILIILVSIIYPAGAYKGRKNNDAFVVGC